MRLSISSLAITLAALTSLSLSNNLVSARPTSPNTIKNRFTLNDHSNPSPLITKRQTSRQAIISRSMARQDRKRSGAADPQVSSPPTPLAPSPETCPGNLYAFFPSMEWDTMEQAETLGRHWSTGGASWTGEACARKCDETPGCNYANIFYTLCEVSNVRGLKMRQGPNIKSIVPGTCTAQRETHNLNDDIECQQLCIVPK